MNGLSGQLMCYNIFLIWLGVVLCLIFINFLLFCSFLLSMALIYKFFWKVCDQTGSIVSHYWMWLTSSYSLGCNRADFACFWRVVGYYIYCGCFGHMSFVVIATHIVFTVQRSGRMELIWFHSLLWLVTLSYYKVGIGLFYISDARSRSI